MPPVTQRSFIKGVDASTDRFDQPRSTLPRISNLLFTRRGSLITCDGSAPLSPSLNPTAAKGSIDAIQQYLTGGKVSASGSAKGPNGAGMGATDGSTTDPWLNPGRITSPDSSLSNCFIPAADFQGDFLLATNFNFAIPGGDTILGIFVEVLRKTSDPVNVIDTAIRLIKAGVQVGANRSTGATWPGSLQYSSFGSSADLWGTTWTPAQINAANFGVAIQGANNESNNINLYVDYVRITVTSTSGTYTAINYNQTIFYLQDPDPGSQLADPTGVTLLGVNVAGGTLVPGTTYTYRVSALDGRQNATPGANEQAIVLPGGMNAVQITWNVVNGAGSYLIWGPTAPLSQSTELAWVAQPDYQQNSSGPIAAPTATYTDATGATSLSNLTQFGTILFGINTTIGALRLFSMVATVVGSYAQPTLLALFPCRAQDSAIPNIPPIDACGGLIGASCQVPQMLQFSNLIVIALGNGWRPQYTDGTTVSPFTNTFTAQYINWQLNTVYLVGDIIQPSPANGHIYKCTQQGESGGAQPAFPTGTGQDVVDNQAVWTEAGFVTASPPPRGAAHAVFHAGSLWVLNTQPMNSADLLDGPSVLRMSDAGNLTSWNPINAAFIGKDDGSEGMGLASFTIAEFGIAPLGSLIVFKNFATYQIVGVFGAPDFDIQALQTDMGCVAPRSIKFISGFGIIRMSHLGFAVLDGVRDRLISEQIRPYIFGLPAVGSAGLPPITGIDLNHMYLIKGDQINNPPMYAAAAPLSGNVSLNRIFMYDLVMRAWTIIDLPSTINPSSFISALYQIRTPGLEPITVVGGFDDGSIQQIQSGDELWQLFTAAGVVNWAFTTPEVFNTGDPQGEILVDTLFIRGTNLDGLPITVSVNLQTENGYVADSRQYEVGSGEFQIMVGINEQCLSANATISGSGRVEIEVVTWNPTPLPSNIPSRIT